jgi:hypothetical protein
VPFPESHGEFEVLVDSMRRLGVVSAFGIVLGPEPTKAAQLEKAAELATPAEQARLNKELAEEKRRLRIEKAREEMRLQLGAVGGHDYTDKQIDIYIDPSVFAE